MLSAASGQFGSLVLADYIEQYARHPESKAADNNGNPSGRDTKGVLSRLAIDEFSAQRILVKRSAASKRTATLALRPRGKEPKAEMSRQTSRKARVRRRNSGAACVDASPVSRSCVSGKPLGSKSRLSCTTARRRPRAALATAGPTYFPAANTLQAGCQGFESPRLHSQEESRASQLDSASSADRNAPCARDSSVRPWIYGSGNNEAGGTRFSAPCSGMPDSTSWRYWVRRLVRRVTSSLSA